MSFKCKIGLHSWNGCKCLKCGKIRNTWHDFRNDCEKCSDCGTVRIDAHDWDGCECNKCGKTKHQWNEENCVVCGALMQKAVVWIVDSSMGWLDIQWAIDGTMKDRDKGFASVWNRPINQAKSFIAIINEHMRNISISECSAVYDKKGIIKLHKWIIEWSNSLNESELGDLRYFLRIACNTILYGANAKRISSWDQVIFSLLYWIGDKQDDLILFLRALSVIALEKKTTMIASYSLECPYRSVKHLSKNFLHNHLKSILQNAINHVEYYGPDTHFIMLLSSIGDLMTTMVIPHFNNKTTKEIKTDLETIALSHKINLTMPG